MRHSIRTPQGGILSPLLCNIDSSPIWFVYGKYYKKKQKKTIFRKGEKRKGSSAYRKLQYLRIKTSVPSIRRELLLKMRTINSNDRLDPNFQRLDYIRYADADDFVILVIGSVHEIILRTTQKNTYKGLWIRTKFR